LLLASACASKVGRSGDVEVKVEGSAGRVVIRLEDVAKGGKRRGG
jgi:hypothetical protein